MTAPWCSFRNFEIEMDTRSDYNKKVERDRLSRIKRIQDPAYRKIVNHKKALRSRVRTKSMVSLKEEVINLKKIIFKLRRRNVERDTHRSCETQLNSEESITEEEEEEDMSGTEIERFDNDEFFSDFYINEVRMRLENSGICFKGIIGLEKEDFDALFSRTSDIYKLYRQNGELITNTYSEGKYRDSDQLFITLFSLRSGDTFEKLFLIFGIHARTIRRICYRTVMVLYDTLSNDLVWPSDSEFEVFKENFKNMVFQEFKDAVCAIDGSEFKVPRKTNGKFYSGKKKQYSVNCLFIVLLNGLFIYHSQLFPGSHDQKDFNQLNLREKFIGKSCGILGDGGFPFNRDIDEDKIIGYNPRKKTKLRELNEDDIDWNTKLSISRVIVENAIGQLKKWRVMGGKLTLCTNRAQNLDLYYKIMRILSF